jgi:hypothetical protein
MTEIEQCDHNWRTVDAVLSICQKCQHSVFSAGPANRAEDVIVSRKYVDGLWACVRAADAMREYAADTHDNYEHVVRDLANAYDTARASLGKD